MRRFAKIEHASWLATLLLLPPGCGEIEHCREGVDPGCRSATPRADGGCDYDLVAFNLIEGGLRCVALGSEEDPCKTCPDGALCVPAEGRCVQFCETPAMLPGSVASPPQIACEAEPGATMPTLAFEEVCRRRCQLECQRVAQACGSGCPEGSCDRPEVQSECASDCPAPIAGGARDIACLVRSCEDQRLSRCSANLACPDGAQVDCTAVACTNDCAFADDGHCDDGDPFASERNDCAWGSDCADCGVRRGAPPAGHPGSVCRYHSNCAGGTLRPRTAEAWCVASEALPGVARCMPDCSRGQPCADGFACHEVTVAVMGTERAAVEEEGLKSQACVPALCI